MNKRFAAVLAVILVMSMVFGMTTFAAASPKASDSGSGSSSSSSAPVYETPWWIIPRAKDYASVNGVRFTSDYVGTTDNFVATVLPVAAPKAQNTFGPYLLQMYLKGAPVRNNFGAFTFTIGVGNKYDGQTAIVNVAYFDGTTATIPVVVSKGKVTVTLNQIAVIAVQFQ